MKTPSKTRHALIPVLALAAPVASAWWGVLWSGNDWNPYYGRSDVRSGYGMGMDRYHDGRGSGGVDFSMGLSGRMHSDMRGYGGGYGAGDGWGRSYSYGSPYHRGYAPHGYGSPYYRGYAPHGYGSPYYRGYAPYGYGYGYPAPAYRAPAAPHAHTTDGRSSGRDASAGTSTVSDADTSGQILTNADGMTLYTYAEDRPGISNCYASCADSWPPALVPDTAKPVDGLSTIQRRDGTRQLALDGMPLYLWVGDRQPGDRGGDGVGGVWQVARRLP